MKKLLLLAALLTTMPLLGSGVKNNTMLSNKEIVETKEPKIIQMSNTNEYKKFRSLTMYEEKRYNKIANKICNEVCIDEEGFAKIDNRYCVLMETEYGLDLWEYFDMVMENGNVIPCITIDQYTDCHVNEIEGSVVTFFVDENKIDEFSKLTGDVSYNKKELEGKIDYIKRY